MASMLKTASKKRSADALAEDSEAQPQKKKVQNKQRVLMLANRGVTQRMRHLMGDLEALLPHIKKDSKLSSSTSLPVLNELADLASCNNVMFFQARHHSTVTDLYLWLAKAPNGPSVKFHVQNVHTMDELKMTGNCLKGSRGILSFGEEFDGEPWLQLLKEMFTHMFGVPKSARRTKPFTDHVLSFSYLDSKIWFRNYQIVEKDPTTIKAELGSKKKSPQTTLVEIGPRFVLTPIRIFEGSFGGPTVFANPEFVAPTAIRREQRKLQGAKYGARKDAEHDRRERMDKLHQRDRGLAGELEVAKLFG